MKRWTMAIACALIGLACADGAVVLESARDIPVAYDVDVVVVGGSTGAVAAAASAAAGGAKVFLAAPRHYLGDDMCATHRLGLAPGELPKTELARKIFTFSPAVQTAPVKLGKNPIRPIKYSADLPSAGVHKDSRRRPMLTDGHYADAARQSVQYNGDVTLTLDLITAQPVGGVHLVAFHRRGEFEVASIAVSISEDSKKWSKPITIANKSVGKVLGNDTPIQLSAFLVGKARYVRVAVRKAPGCARILLGEVAVEGMAKKTIRAEPKTDPKPKYATPTPMHVKRTLDDALLDAGVQFLYGCYVTELLIDRSGRPAGIVMANRAGRQAVRAKVIIDATDRAVAARAAGAKFKPYPAGKQSFSRIVFGGKPEGKLAGEAKKIGSVQRGRGSGDLYEYSLTIAMKDDSFASFAAADQTARNLTWHEDQLGGAEQLFQIPPDPMTGRKSVAGDWSGADKIDLDALRPAGVDRMYVLGGCADISRQAAGKLLGPAELTALGERVGAAAGAEARSVSAPAAFAEIAVAGPRAVSPVSGEVREVLKGVRSTKAEAPTIRSEPRALPVIGKYDVVVIGGGTGGAPAGIGAARKGAKTLVVEVLHGLGGVGTLGMIAKYYHGNRVGFSTEIDKAVGGPGWNVEKKMEWYRQQLVNAGADIWFGTLGCGTLVENNRVKGVVVATHHGRGVILAGTVIDSTGNASMASAAGAECTVIDAEHISVQGTGLPPLEPGAGYTNTDWTFHDDDDVLDMWRMFVVAKAKYKNAFDLGQLIDTRARRRIVGDLVIMPMDIQNKRTFPDTIVISKSNFDNHGFSSHTIFMIKPPDHAGLVAHVPYRCLLPKGFDGILVTGLGISAHGDAMPVLRMQPDIQNQGYAAGVAAAMAAEDGKTVRGVDIKDLQKHLVEKGILPKSVLSDTDSYPMSSDQIAAAVKSVTKGYQGISLILAQPGDAIDPLKKAYKSVSGPDKIVYAHILGMLYDPSGAETLAAAIKAAEWDKGWNFRGMGQFGRTTSPLDNLIIALGRTGKIAGLDAILDKIAQLNPRSEFSHYRAVAMAAESIGDRRAAKPLADLLLTKGVSGHAFLEIKDVRDRTPASRVDTSTRNNSLRELILARALYRCGDYQGLGEKILKQYARDLRGHYSRHAKAVLAGKGGRVRD